MRSLARSFAIVLLVCLVDIPAQDSAALRMQLSIARQQLSLRNYYECVTESERLLFFDTAQAFTQAACLLAAEACRKANRPDDAIRYYVRASKAPGTDSAVFMAETGIIAMLGLKKQRDAALRRAEYLAGDARFSSQRAQIHYWKGWVNAISGFWEEAAVEFQQAGMDTVLTNLCREAASKTLNIKTMRIASALLPGYAQFYTGHYLNGILSLAYHGLWGYLTITASLAGRAADAVLIGDLLWLRFYTGNLQNAEKFCVDFNAGISNEYLIFLQNNYQGLKP